MNNYDNLIFSISFCFLCYLLTGYAFKRFFQISRLTFSESFFIGAGLIAITTTFVSMFLPGSFHLASLTIMCLALIAGVIAVVCDVQKGELIINEMKSRFLFPLIFLVMIIPLLVGTVHIRLWGDELNMVGSMVRYWLDRGNFFVDPHAEFSFYGHPRLWVIMLYQSLSLQGVMHEVSGRWLTIFIVFFGAIFVWKEYYKYWNFGRWEGLLLASFWMVLVFGPMFAWSASWYYSIFVSILVMMSFYYVVVPYNEDGSIDLKLVTVSAILMAMVVGIRPDGFLYLPLLVALLFIGHKKNLRSAFRSSLIILAPSVLIYFGWRIYMTINGLDIMTHDKTTNPLEIMGRIDQLQNRFWPVTVEMFRQVITEWNLTGFWFLCFIMTVVFSFKLYKQLNIAEKRLLLLLTVPAYKFILMMFENSMFFTDKVRMGRHIMQTAPILYFMLGFLFLKWLDTKYGTIITRLSKRTKAIIVSLLLSIILVIQIMIGTLYAYLPSELNNYMEYWTKLIRKEYPDYRSVQLLIPDSAPPTTRIHPTWRYYATATPNIYTNLPSIIENIPGNVSNRSEYLDVLQSNEVDAVLVYSGDEEIGPLTGLNLSEGKIYLLGVEQNYFRIVRSEKIPYSDIWVVPWRTKAIKRLIQSVY